MKFCPECGSAVGNGKFCPECGHRLTLSDGGVQTERDEAELLAPFETVRHQNGKYAILALKNKSELIVEVPACVESIMDGAFMNSCVMKVTLPEGLVQIRDNAFAGCKDLVQINFPSTLIAIGTRAFSGCEQLDVAPPSSVRLGYNAFAFTAYNHRVVREEYERRQAEEERRRREAEEARRREQEERERDPEYCLQTAQSYEKSAQNHSLDKEKYYKNAFSMYCKAAQLGNAEGQYNLGRYYGGGYGGVERNIDESLSWYRKAAEQKHAPAMQALGHIYFHGHGVPENKNEGIRWWKKAAEAGEAWSASELGKLYYNGLGVTKDYTQAVVWYRKAAELGCREMNFLLGECYHFGRGVAVDHAEALKWYSLVDSPKAFFMVGEHYYHGWGVQRDLKLAKDWYRYGGPTRGHYWDSDAGERRYDYSGRLLKATMRLADIALEDKNYSLARQYYEEVMRYRSGNAEAKLEEYYRADDVSLRLGECYYHLAENYFNSGKISDADSACQSALKYGFSVPYSLRDQIEEKKKASSVSWYRKCWGGS